MIHFHYLHFKLDIDVCEKVCCERSGFFLKNKWLNKRLKSLVLKNLPFLIISKNKNMNKKSLWAYKALQIFAHVNINVM